MRENKTLVLNFRVTASTKEALREAAKREQRSLTNMLEVMIHDYVASRVSNASRATEERHQGAINHGSTH